MLSKERSHQVSSYSSFVYKPINTVWRNSSSQSHATLLQALERDTLSSLTWWYWISLSSIETTTSFCVSNSFPASALFVPRNTKRSWTMGCRAGIAEMRFVWFSTRKFTLEPCFLVLTLQLLKVNCALVYYRFYTSLKRPHNQNPNLPCIMISLSIYF